MKNILIILVAIQSIFFLTSCKEDDISNNDSKLLEEAHNYYSFDSGEEDGSQNGIDCDFVGNVSIVPGIKGNAIYINNPANDPFSNDAFVKLPAFDYSQDWTISFFTKMNFSSADGTPHGTRIWSAGALYQSGNTQEYDYHIGFCLNTNGHDKSFILFRNKNNQLETPYELRPNIRDNKWHHVIIRKNNDKVDYYLDNIFINSLNSTSQYLTNNLHVSYLGKHLWLQSSSVKSAARFNGYIDEYIIYNYALSVEKIKLLYELNY